MMLILGLLLCISQVQSDDTQFLFTPDNAMGADSSWSWKIERTFTLAADQELELTINTQGMTGISPDGDDVTLGEHYEFEATFQGMSTYNTDYNFMVVNGLAACSDQQDCAYLYKCDFKKEISKSKIKNGKTPQSIKVTFDITGNDVSGHCAFLDDVATGLANWAKTVLIITIVTLVLCVLCVVLVCCGVVKCCCVQQQPNTVVVETAKY